MTGWYRSDTRRRGRTRHRPLHGRAGDPPDVVRGVPPDPHHDPPHVRPRQPLGPAHVERPPVLLLPRLRRRRRRGAAAVRGPRPVQQRPAHGHDVEDEHRVPGGCRVRGAGARRPSWPGRKRETRGGSRRRCGAASRKNGGGGAPPLVLEEVHGALREGVVQPLRRGRTRRGHASGQEGLRRGPHAPHRRPLARFRPPPDNQPHTEPLTCRKRVRPTCAAPGAATAGP